MGRVGMVEEVGWEVGRAEMGREDVGDDEHGWGREVGVRKVG